MIKIKIAMLAIFLFASPAWAVFDLQAYVGKRSGDFNDGTDKDSISGLNYGAAFHFSPIPFVPVAIGLAAEYISYDEVGSLKDVTGYLVIPQIYVWVPIGLLSVKPFGKLGYGIGAITGDGDVAGQTVKAAYKTTGLHVTFGVKWEPPVIPFLSLFAQFDYGLDKSEVVEIKLDGDEITPAFNDAEDFKNTAIHVGVEFKI